MIIKKIQVISIYGEEVPSDVQDELDCFDISTHYADSAFKVHKESMPYTHAWLVKNGMIKEGEALTWNDRVICVLWGT